MMIIFKNIFYSDLKYFFKKIILNIDILKRLKNNIKNLFKIVFLPKKKQTSKGDYFRFGSVFIKKNNQTEFFLKKTETGSNRPVSVRFLGKKPVQTGLARFFWFWLGFLGFFPVLARFFLVFFGFGSVRFFTYKTEIELNRLIFLKF